jgi:hypothetical protein
MRRIFLAALLGLALSGCASAPVGPQRFSGAWAWQFETSAFLTDRGDGPYWLEAAGPAWSQITAPLQQSGRGPWGRVHLVIEGELSPQGSFGHLGAYRHKLRVTRVIAAELISADGPPSGS